VVYGLSRDKTVRPNEVNVEHITPLIQTLLWVGLITGLVWRFHTPINGALLALQKRIESGSNIKAGPFEITDQLKPQLPEQQRQKAAEELQEVLEDISPEKSSLATAPAIVPASIQARHFHAEDLVLRAIQAEQGVTISRQVTAGSDMGFDGVFATDGRLNIVEVKYARSLTSLPRFKPTIERLNIAIARYGWKNVQIILAVVFENKEDMLRAQELLKKVTAVSAAPLIVQCYSYDALNSKFGVGT